jgi:hypothetical protein
VLIIIMVFLAIIELTNSPLPREDGGLKTIVADWLLLLNFALLRDNHV